MRLQSAIFDMDGTLLDSMPMWQELGPGLLRRFGVEPEADLLEHLKSMTLRQGTAYCRETYHLEATEEELMRRSSLGCVLSISGTSEEPAAIFCQNSTATSGLYPAIVMRIRPI